MILIKTRPYPPDVRVDKEIKALCEAGHKVFVFTKRIKTEKAGRDVLIQGGAWVERIDLPQLGVLSRIRTDMIFQYPQWESHLAHFIMKNNIGVLHVHNLLHVPISLKVAKKFSLPVIVDLHENQPAAFKVYRRNMPFIRRFANSIGKNYFLTRWIESKSLRKCNKIIIVVPEAAKRLYQYGIPEDDIVVVSNTEDETTFPFVHVKADEKIINRYASHWTVCYIGNLGPHRGIDTMLKAIPIICKEIPNFKFLIVGARDHHTRQVLDDASRLGIEEQTEVLEWVPFHEVSSFIFASRIGIIPHNNFEHTQTTIPHKLFQYMLCKKPVLVSSCRPLWRIVEETGAGVVFQADNSHDLAQKLLWMYRQGDEIDEMGIQGRRAALGPYSWRHGAARLVQIYDEIHKSRFHAVKPIASSG